MPGSGSLVSPPPGGLDLEAVLPGPRSPRPIPGGAVLGLAGISVWGGIGGNPGAPCRAAVVTSEPCSKFGDCTIGGD